jgi:FixJ family two-component response regulator
MRAAPRGHTLVWIILMSNLQKIIAVIDDDPEMRASMARLLLAYGYNARTFDSAETFLTCASTCRAICLLVDIHLGDISGVELADKLAADGFKFPIIFMTGNGDPVIERQAIAAGGIAFLCKPFPATTLIDAIKKAVG